MELFNHDNETLFCTKGANYIRFLELPKIEERQVSFANGSVLNPGDCISGIDVRKSLKGNTKGFQMEAGACLQFCGVYQKSSIIKYLIFYISPKNAIPIKTRVDGYFWFSCFLFTDHVLLLQNSSGGFMDMKPVFENWRK